MQPIEFGLVGAGWRSEFYLRIARALPERFRVCGVVVRDPEKGRGIESAWGVRTFRSIGDLLNATAPRFVVSSVPWAASARVILDLVDGGMPVLSETPPAPTLEAMVDLYEAVQAREGRVQVAEQVHLRPQHQAQLAVAASGRLGRVTQAQLSVSHGYHGISLMRRFLGCGLAAPRVRGFSFAAPVIAGGGRSGPPQEEVVHDSNQEFYCFDYGDRFGLIDFSYDQYFGWIRNDRLLVRGERGEIQNNTCKYLKDIRTPLQVSLTRREGGAEGNLEGKSLQGIEFGEEWAYRNPYAAAPLSDDEIAVAECLSLMDRYVHTGEPFYSLAEACQDHYLNLLAQEAIRSDKMIAAQQQPWSKVQAVVQKT